MDAGGALATRAAQGVSGRGKPTGLAAERQAADAGGAQEASAYHRAA